MSRESSEIVKYASNGFLANKISFANMLSELCEATGGNVRDVTKGMGMDDRIGPRFLHSGIGYGGSCFPKDVKALIALSRETGVPLPLIQATHEINQHQRERYFKKLLAALPANATVGILGLSFKPRTDDMREAPSLDLIPMLLEAGHTVQVHDPVAMDNAKKIVEGDIKWNESITETIQGADAVIVLTEWDEFRGIDLKKMNELMKGKDLFDGRNIYDPNEVKEAGLTYYGIGIS
jgi:UDPglucose 6-dehydrogenase